MTGRVRRRAKGARVARMVAFLAAAAMASWARAGESRPWVTISNCQYVAHEGNDADSFVVQAGTNRFVARLYHVDAVERTLEFPERVREQSEHFGTTLDGILEAGRDAHAWVASALADGFTIRTRWASAMGRSRLPRHYVLIEVRGADLGEELVRRGWAWPKGVRVNLPTGERAAEVVRRLEAAEAEARAAGRGAWGTRTAQPR